MAISLIKKIICPHESVTSSVARRKANAVALLALSSLAIISTLIFYVKVQTNPLGLKLTTVMSAGLISSFILSRSKFVEFSCNLFLLALAFGIYARIFIIPHFPEHLIVTTLLYGVLIMPLTALLKSPQVARLIMFGVVILNIVIPIKFIQTYNYELGVLASNMKIFSFGMFIFSMIQTWIHLEAIANEASLAESKSFIKIGQTIVTRLKAPLQQCVKLHHELVKLNGDNETYTCAPLLGEINQNILNAVTFSKSLQFLNNKDVKKDDIVSVGDLVSNLEQHLPKQYLHHDSKEIYKTCITTNKDLATTSLNFLLIKLLNSSDNTNFEININPNVGSNKVEFSIIIIPIHSSDLFSNYSKEDLGDIEFEIIDRLVNLSGGTFTISTLSKKLAFTFTWMIPHQPQNQAAS